MNKFKCLDPIELEPGFYYHNGLTSDICHFDADVFDKGCHVGQFASVIEVEEGIYKAVRDPLGIGKMFYTETKDGKIHFSDNFASLFNFKSPIFSVPTGAMVKIGTGGQRELIRKLGIYPMINENLDKKAFEKENSAVLNDFRLHIENRLKVLFTSFRNYEAEGWTFFVALSGGLDSSIIASYAAKYLDKPIACTLDLGKSEDSEKSQKIAGYLGIDHLVFSTEQKEIIEALEGAPSLCQDYRDFNVHCATLNILLAKNIKRYVQSNPDLEKNKVIVLTGDLMNEFTCDYEGEKIGDVEYYRLPKVEKKELQNTLIRGLDTSDREISVFKAYGLHCIQPYAMLYDLYESLSEDILETSDPKKLLNSFLVDKDLLTFMPKVKLRAQVGSRENMGILGLCHSKGINNKVFRKNLLEKSGYEKGDIPIFAGRYEIEIFK